MAGKETGAEFRARVRSVGYMPGGRSRVKSVKEFKRPDGVRVKATTDDLGNTVTEHNTPDDRVDVLVRPAHVRMQLPKVN